MNKVTIENYTEHCLLTWGGNNQLERAELGIIGEFGECCEVEKKFLRGDFDDVERDKRMLKEMGDCLYYIAIFFDLNDYNLPMSLRDTKPILIGQSHVGFLTGITKLINCESVIYILEEFLSYCEHYGFTIEQVMQANIDKLSCRAKRNKTLGERKWLQED